MAPNGEVIFVALHAPQLRMVIDPGGNVLAEGKLIRFPAKFISFVPIGPNEGEFRTKDQKIIDRIKDSPDYKDGKIIVVQTARARQPMPDKVRVGGLDTTAPKPEQPAPPQPDELPVGPAQGPVLEKEPALQPAAVAPEEAPIF